MVAITIDGRKTDAKENSTVLENVRSQGIILPTLCHHEEVSAFGSCRLCTVEIKANGKWQLATACNTPVAKGLEVRTNSEQAIEARALAARLLYFKISDNEGPSGTSPARWAWMSPTKKPTRRLRFSADSVSGPAGKWWAPAR